MSHLHIVVVIIHKVEECHIVDAIHRATFHTVFSPEFHISVILVGGCGGGREVVVHHLAHDSAIRFENIVSTGANGETGTCIIARNHDSD